MYCQCNHTRMENIFLISISGEGELLNLLAGLKPQLRSVQALHPFQLRASRNNARSIRCLWAPTDPVL